LHHQRAAERSAHNLNQQMSSIIEGYAEGRMICVPWPVQQGLLPSSFVAVRRFAIVIGDD
jgi:hypothetical protein